MSLDFIMTGMAVVLEFAVFGLLMRQRAWRRFPLLCLYLGWCVVSDIFSLLILHELSSFYCFWYAPQAIIDALLRVALLMELPRELLTSYSRENEGVITMDSVPAVATLVAFTGLTFSSLTGIFVLPHINPMFAIVIRLQDTISMLFLFCLLMTMFLRKSFRIDAGDVAMQVLAGISFYSTVSLGVSLLHAHGIAVESYRLLDQLVSASFVVTLLYWVICFLPGPATLVPSDAR